jgi:hypothetical protein
VHIPVSHGSFKGQTGSFEWRVPGVAITAIMILSSLLFPGKVPHLEQPNGRRDRKGSDVSDSGAAQDLADFYRTKRATSPLDRAGLLQVANRLGTSPLWW